MSGAFGPNFRKGNLSEYQALYFLSHIGSSLTVPRQEDVGIDFYCSINIEDGHHELVKEQFIIQLKSNEKDKIEYGSVIKSGKNEKKKWNGHELEWYFNLELPLFYGVMNKKANYLDIYSSSFKWYNYWQKDFMTIEFLINQPSENMREIHASDDEDISGWAGEIQTKRSKIKTFVKTGPPLIRLSPDVVLDKKKLEKLKRILREAVRIEKNNIIFKTLNLPYFNWIHKVDTNKSFVPAYYFATNKVSLKEKELIDAITPIIISLGLLYKHENLEKFNAIKTLLKLIPEQKIPENVKKALEEK